MDILLARTKILTKTGELSWAELHADAIAKESPLDFWFAWGSILCFAIANFYPIIKLGARSGFWHIKPFVLQWHKILNTIGFVLAVGHTILAPTGDMAYRIVTIAILTILMIDGFRLRIHSTIKPAFRLLHTQRVIFILLIIGLVAFHRGLY